MNILHIRTLMAFQFIQNKTKKHDKYKREKSFLCVHLRFSLIQ